MSDQEAVRFLIYSHDTFGLGHLRRCRAIAHALVDHRRDLSVLILSGSPVIGSYDFSPRVDYVRIPGIVKLGSGGYTAHGLDISIDDAVAIRETIIRSVADAFKPHALLVDKEPLGARGEMDGTLRLLKERGTRLILGLRDVLDEDDLLRDEWERKGAMAALTDLYDDIWIYGRPEVCEPLAGISPTPAIQDKMTYTGYLRRWSSQGVGAGKLPTVQSPFVLVTTGGGSDGVDLVDWVLRAYEHDPNIPQDALIVLGPFLDPDSQHDFMERAERLDCVSMIDFTSNMEHLMMQCDGVIAMGGYNTISEILSFDKPSVVVPRMTPRLEQFIRATQMDRMGLLRNLPLSSQDDAAKMATAIRQLEHQPRPSNQMPAEFLDGHNVIADAIDRSLPSDPSVAHMRQNGLLRSERSSNTGNLGLELLAKY